MPARAVGTFERAGYVEVLAPDRVTAKPHIPATANALGHLRPITRSTAWAYRRTERSRRKVTNRPVPDHDSGSATRTHVVANAGQFRDRIGNWSASWSRGWYTCASANSDIRRRPLGAVRCSPKHLGESNEDDSCHGRLPANAGESVMARLEFGRKVEVVRMGLVR